PVTPDRGRLLVSRRSTWRSGPMTSSHRERSEVPRSVLLDSSKQLGPGALRLPDVQAPKCPGAASGPVLLLSEGCIMRPKTVVLMSVAVGAGLVAAFSAQRHSTGPEPEAPRVPGSAAARHTGTSR